MTERPSVQLSYFFKYPSKFPWRFLGYDAPVYGDTHLYLCRILADYDPPNSQYLLGKPTFSELERHSKNNPDSLSGEIFDYCSGLYRHSRMDRDSTAMEVMIFLRNFDPFMKKFQTTIDSAYYAGDIIIPDECKPIEGKTYNGY